MRPARPRLLIATLLAGALVAWIAVGGLPGGIGRVHFPSAAAAAAAYSCTAVPVAASPSASASATPSPSSSPASLCVSVQDEQSSVGTGDSAYWAVQVWAQGGAVPGASVWLNVDQGLTASFSSACPSGNGGASCNVGNLGVGGAPSTYQMEAQVPIPSSANITSLTLTATAYAATTPAMSADPQAAQTLTVIPPPAPSASPTPTSSATSGSASPSATPASSASSASTSPATSSSSATPGQSSTSATAGRSTGAPGTGLPVVPPGLAPSLGPMPTGTGPVGPAPELLVPSGTIANMLPVIAPSPSGTIPGSSPAAEVQSLPVTTSESSDSLLGMPLSTAQDLGLIFLFAAIFLAGTRFARRQPATSAKAGANPPSRARRDWHRSLPRRLRRTPRTTEGGQSGGAGTT